MLVEVSSGENKVNRCCVFVIRTADFVDECVLQTAAAWSQCCQRLIVLCTGSLPESSLRNLRRTGAEIVPPPQEAEEVSASAVLSTFLRRKDQRFFQGIDWLLICGDWLMGPVNPLQPILDGMEASGADFWGLTSCRTMISGRDNDFKVVEPYLQCHLCAVSAKVLSSPAFSAFWERCPGKSAPYDPLFSEGLTRSLQRAGFSWEACIRPEDGTENSLNPMAFEPVKLIREYNCPFFFADCFSASYAVLLRHSLADQARELLFFLKESARFDTDQLWRHLLHTRHLSDLHRSAGLFRVLSGDNVMAPPASHTKTALILHLHYPDLFAEYYSYALNMPADADIYITTSTEEDREHILKVFSAGPWARIEVRMIPNRGRDVSALLVGCADIVCQYDCVCFAHDKRSHTGEARTHGVGFSEHCMHNTLGSRGLARQIIGMFHEEPRLGLVFPPPPCHGRYISTLADEWTINFEATKQLADRLGLTVPMDEAHEPIAPLGTVFWFRPEALERLFRQGWKYEDFPEEPIENDGTLLHAIERVYPFAAQQAGFFSLWCASESYAGRYALNLYQTVQGSQKELVEGSVLRWLLLRAKRGLKRFLPDTLWNCLRAVYRRGRG